MTLSGAARSREAATSAEGIFRGLHLLIDVWQNGVALGGHVGYHFSWFLFGEEESEATGPGGLVGCGAVGWFLVKRGGGAIRGGGGGAQVSEGVCGKRRGEGKIMFRGPKVHQV